ncbi:MAG: hypothetical protein KatS3mg110_0878 [Pirellulaceae bacterium]|nr:MAG: hypothetical protein KatS3mg110_0878 [Pirellulaceae bacterium]
MQRLVAELREQQAEAARLDEAILKNLEELGVWSVVARSVHTPRFRTPL